MSGLALLAAAAGLPAFACTDGGSTPPTGASTGGGGGTSDSSGSVGAGPVAVSASSSAMSSSASGGGGDDAAWSDVSWWDGPCPVQVAGNPAAAFPALEWGACDTPLGGCERLIENWPKQTPTSLRTPSLRKRAGGIDMTFMVTYAGVEYRSPAFSPDGVPVLVHRLVPGGECGWNRPTFSSNGYWLGAVAISNRQATFVHQEDGLPLPHIESLPLALVGQHFEGAGNVFAVEALGGTSITIYDRESNETFTTPPTPRTTAEPRISSRAVLYRRWNGVNDPTGWVWDRSTGEFRELIGAGTNVVADLRTDDETLVWVESGPYDDETNTWPPSTLYTSPFTTQPEAIVPTPRWVDLAAPSGNPSAIGGGYYAIAGYPERVIYLVRLSDGRRFVYTVPGDEFASRVEAIPYIDDEVFFVKTEVAFFRQRIDALGDGEPGL